MKICKKCKVLFREQVLACPECRSEISEVSLLEAMHLTEQKAFRQYMTGRADHRLPEPHIQYHIRCYLANRSLFLDFDLYKNRLKRGRRSRTFFIAPVNLTALINIPWFLFNLINSNLFHMQYTEYCPLCDCKFIKGYHPREECDYNIEHASILDDILNGRIVKRKPVYMEYAEEKQQLKLKSAYYDLFCRPIFLEVFWDFISIGSTILSWLYLAIHVSYPMAQILIQKLQQADAYEWVVLSLR